MNSGKQAKFNDGVWLVSSELNPIALGVFYVAVFRARIPVHAAPHIVSIVELAHFSPHGLAAHILNDYGQPLSSVLQEVRKS